MIRILLNVKQNSPFLQTFSGDIIVEYVNFSLEQAITSDSLLRCSFTHKPGQQGFKNDRGFNTELFDLLKPQIDVMIHSYAMGMKLAPHDYSWVDDSKDKSLNEWLTEKGIDSEIAEI